ncbi:iron-containing alcohol dehydrogenase [Bifidobacterium amazonense]|uniref:Iron-containing alcohol dehydrogenase n=1 Tax=Bifidobacterium amazonense TaxID=2809027 RepID=A0ABS9VTQ6_9BIFI|nr:iron-containing alcohol dehydrogenase [Bifidobacterium amazonense]MCH9275482.1 iron-containing alcohol dehydrogenase [Bifidobacterium amazonense]
MANITNAVNTYTTRIADLPGTEVVFGVGAERRLPYLLEKNHVTSLLFVYSGTYVYDLGIRDAVLNAAKELGIKVIENGDVQVNPRLELVHRLIEEARANDVDFVIAAGGGSAFDTGKAVALGKNYDGDVWDFYAEHRGREPEHQVLGVGTISTLPGTSSEVSFASVITKGHLKGGASPIAIKPAFTIINPEYSRTVPYRYLAAATVDMIVHNLEKYFTPNAPLALVDQLEENIFRAEYEAAERFAADPGSLQARADLHWLSAYVNPQLRSLDATGPQYTIHEGVIHIIEHSLSGVFDIVHGEGNAAVLIALVRYEASRHPEKFAKLAVRVFGADPYLHTEEENALLLADKLEELIVGKLHVPIRLSEQGVTREGLDEVLDQLGNLNAYPIGHYTQLSRDDVKALLDSAF